MGRVLPIRAGSAPILLTPDSAKLPEALGSVAALTSDFQKFSPFSQPLEDGADKQQPEVDSVFMPQHMQRTGTNGTMPLDYSPYYPSSDYYAGLAKEHSLESQDSSTLSSPSECLPQTGSAGHGATAPQDSLFQFSIGKILEDEAGASIPVGTDLGPDGDIGPFYEGVTYEAGESDRSAKPPMEMERSDNIKR